VPDSAIRKYEAYVNSMKQDVGEATAFSFDTALKEPAAGEEAPAEGAAVAEEDEEDMYA
jgi:hypothetical protein